MVPESGRGHVSDVVLDGLDYPVVFCEDAAASLPRLIVRGRSAPRALVIADRRLGPRARACALALTRAGARVIGVRLLRGGERCKSVASLDTLWQLFAALRADRSTLVVALGGGTITDVAGFAAATYMRGLPWAAVATTVLGMADAAIGGKTAL
ncbi:MAG: iron-containing alcohol dehydrogenase, partial [Candidatus Eremiobacteraeota bacterium]|nr:iron-containing alcohol dehydrogenase [Candidatus Eremiobacteraeota bacterium]